VDSETPEQPYSWGPARPPMPAPPIPVADLEASEPPSSRPRRRWLWATSLVAVVAVVGAAIVVTTGHSSKSPLAVLTAASGRTTGSGTARMSSVERITENGESFEVANLSGAADFGHKTSSITMSSRGSDLLEMRQVGGVSYMSTSLVDLPGGAEWIAIRPSDLKIGADESPLGSSDPSSGLQFLSAIKGDPREVGHEQVDGTDTTHYRFTIDLESFFDLMSKSSKALGTDSFAASAEQLRGIIDLAKLPAQAWIDGEGRVRKFEFEMRASQGGESIKVVSIMTFSHFDEPVSVSAPPASDVIPFSEFPDFFSSFGTADGELPTT
jgi:hypothetical protein